MHAVMMETSTVFGVLHLIVFDKRKRRKRRIRGKEEERERRGR